MKVAIPSATRPKAMNMTIGISSPRVEALGVSAQDEEELLYRPRWRDRCQLLRTSKPPACSASNAGTSCSREGVRSIGNATRTVALHVTLEWFCGLLRGGSMLPGKREELLPEVASRHVVAETPYFARETPVRPSPRCRTGSRGRRNARRSCGRWPRVERVMPVMEVRRHDQVLQRRPSGRCTLAWLNTAWKPTMMM